ncbi:hypothetical protein BFP76_06370 [Amylibacter kogurei]|uniref:N-acetylmuramoyl-L-alanine amidase n=2 Tax=Paramylibacter kogurei TaxID=1889778 RepID=A0A2G5K8D8_9RHOB|nr:hypothetical protein BFP76_06370 [Amylibacter kogurei]
MTALIFCFIQSWATIIMAQDFGALARIDPSRTKLDDKLWGLQIELGLTQPVPFRVYTLGEPYRLVMDFKQVDWAQLPSDFVEQSETVTDARYGAFRPGWSRMVLTLSEPMVVKTAEMGTENSAGVGQLAVYLEQVNAEDFAKYSTPPNDALWDLPAFKGDMIPKKRQDGTRPIIVMLDPGHGGLDTGAIYDGHREKDLVLQFALELKEALIRTGRFQAFMTRGDDEFISLPGRIAAARAENADVLISLHADAVTSGSASGITVYTLSNKASNTSAELLASQLSRSDLLAGVDLTDQDDELAGVLMDLARLETFERSDMLAEMMVLEIAQSVGKLRSRPHLAAGFAVLKAPDIPSILIELGFMTNRRDLNNLITQSWRSKVIDGIVLALDSWAVEDAAAAKLLRQ